MCGNFSISHASQASRERRQEFLVFSGALAVRNFGLPIAFCADVGAHGFGHFDRGVACQISHDIGLSMADRGLLTFAIEFDMLSSQIR